MHQHDPTVGPLGLLATLWASFGVGRLFAAISPDQLGPWANATAGALLVVGTAGLTVWGQVRNRAREEAVKDEERRRASLTAEIEDLRQQLSEATEDRGAIRGELDQLKIRHEDLLKTIEIRNTGKD